MCLCYFLGCFLQMLSVIDDVTACSDSHNMQLGSKLSSSLLRVSVVQSLLAESAKVLLTAVLWAVQCCSVQEE